MNWYYAKDGQQAGPVTDEELMPLVQSGVVAPSTLVWHSGLAGWQAFAEASGALPVALRPLVGGNQSGAVPGADRALCSQCGNVFPADEVVQLGGLNVCAACKPLLLQKLQQGVSNAGVYGVSTIRFAGFWIRLAAAILDSLILLPFNLACQFVFRMATGANLQNNLFAPTSSQSPLAVLMAFAVYWVVIVALAASYNGICLSRFGGLPGMLICGLRVIRPDGHRITFWRGVGRYFAAFVSAMILCLGYLFIVFDEQKRALHDFICDTRVIYK